MKGGNGYNRGLCSVSLAGWPCRVSQALRIWLQILWLKANVAGVHHPKDKSWSSFDSPAAAPRAVLSSTSSLPTSACAVMAAFIERIGFLQPHRQGKRRRPAHRARPSDVLEERGRPVLAYGGPPDQASRQEGCLKSPEKGGFRWLAWRNPPFSFLHERTRMAAPLTSNPPNCPADAVEVGRIADAWGVKGWFKVLPHSSQCRGACLRPSAGICSPPSAGPRRVLWHGAAATDPPGQGPLRHGGGLGAEGIDDRSAAEALRGARVFVPRSSFPCYHGRTSTTGSI
jgi:hypothetical protein